MNKTTKRIGLILLIIILLPTVVFVINEVVSLNNNEKIIKRIYNDQLEAILYSVNQYSEDVVSSWAKRINEFLDESNKAKTKFNTKKVDSLYDEFPSLMMICVADSINDKNIEIITPKDETGYFQFDNSEILPRLRKILIRNEAVLKRLITYKKEGYRKLEPLKSDSLAEVSLLAFIDNYSSNKKIICLVIDPKVFVQRILSSKIQEAARSEFIISITNPGLNFRFNSTLDTQKSDIQQQRALWIFPDFKIGISLVGKTIDDLVKERIMGNIMLIGLVTIVLISGAWFIFRNIKKEMQLAQIKSDFVSNVSHELRTPLSLISMFSETLELDRVKSEEKKREYYSIISQEANRLGRIVNTILSFSKMEAGKRQFNFVDAYINDIAENINRSYKFHLEQKGFTFNLEKDETIPIIKIDEEAVSEALVNLVDNAVKYSDLPDRQASQQKVITVRTGKENDFVFIEVEDKGIGIPQKDQKKIYEKFFRVSSGNVHNVKGSGLGLSIVKHIMDAHNGRIELTSELNRGSRFRLVFPFEKN